MDHACITYIAKSADLIELLLHLSRLTWQIIHPHTSNMMKFIDID